MVEEMKEHQFATPLLPNRLIEHRLKQEPVARAMLYPGDVRPLGLRLFCLQIASKTCPAPVQSCSAACVGS